MRYSYTRRFKKSYGQLDPKDRERVDKSLRLLAENPNPPFYPSLNVHKLHGVMGTPPNPDQPLPPIWEMHASRGVIVTFQWHGELIILRNCGQHEAVLRSP